MLIPIVIHLYIFTGQSWSHPKRAQRPRFVRDQHGHVIDPKVVRQREADDARMVAAAKQKEAL
jgi:hypothetical protein